MATARCHRTATHAPPKPAAARGLASALQALAGECGPMPADAQAQTWRELQLVPSSKRQGDLPLSLPEPDSQ
jgi:hypothetical protein